LNPRYTKAYINRGLSYHQLGDNTQAIADYNTALGIDPQNVYAYYNRGCVRYKLKQMQLAIEDFDKVVELDPNHVKAYLNRGLALYKLGDVTAANKDFYLGMCINAEAYLYYQAQRSTPDINSYFKEAPQVKLNNAVEYYNTTLYTISTSLSSPALNSNWNQEDLDSRDSIICEGEFIND
jgi:tetratricopeptide (TPR) repeat protein